MVSDNFDDPLVTFHGDDVVDFPRRWAHVHTAEHKVLCDRRSVPKGAYLDQVRPLMTGADGGL